MGRLTSVITGKALAFDTSPLIYYIEQHPQYLQVTDDLFNAIDSGDATGMTSILTLLEVLVQPIRSGRIDLANEYRQLLQRSRGISLFSIVGATCEVFGPPACEVRMASNPRRDPGGYRSPQWGGNDGHERRPLEAADGDSHCCLTRLPLTILPAC